MAGHPRRSGWDVQIPSQPSTTVPAEAAAPEDSRASGCGDAQTQSPTAATPKKSRASCCWEQVPGWGALSPVRCVALDPDVLLCVGGEGKVAVLFCSASVVELFCSASSISISLERLIDPFYFYINDFVVLYACMCLWVCFCYRYN